MGIVSKKKSFNNNNLLSGGGGGGGAGSPSVLYLTSEERWICRLENLKLV